MPGSPFPVMIFDTEEELRRFLQGIWGQSSISTIILPSPALSPQQHQHNHHNHQHHHHHQQQHHLQQHLAHQPTTTTNTTATILPLFSHHQQGTLLRLSPVYLNTSGGLGSALGCNTSSRTPSHQYISNPELTFEIGSRSCLSRRCRQESSCLILWIICLSVCQFVCLLVCLYNCYCLIYYLFLYLFYGFSFY